MGIDEQTVQLLDELVSDPLARDETLGLLQRPVDLAGMKRFVALLGFDPRSVDYLTGRPIPEDRRVISTGGPFRSLRAALSEQEREATGLKRLLFRAGWNPQALIGSGAFVLASGLGIHAVLAKSEKFAWLPKPARQLLMFAWYADGAFYLGKGIVDAAKAKRDF
ncbi:hypothetical protein AAHB37_08310 [Glutamicibacter halophytocola]|uniref:hypothetical protein n=1 Tax=Glutamicibacter halophytocola TaxID=1933880 RepID=UPI00321A2E0F